MRERLCTSGRSKIEWAWNSMPVLQHLFDQFSRSKPLSGLTVGACLHVTSETANLMRVLKAAGARVFLCASNPLSTQDDVAASLREHFGISVFAKRGVSRRGYYRHIQCVVSTNPDITMDDGADVISLIHKNWLPKYAKILGGTEETTTGVVRLRAMEKEGSLKYPVIAVNDALTKHMFDNRYGTGQSTLDGIMRATNVLFAGKCVVVAGYGWCGRGIAAHARGIGSNVVVTEVEPRKALEASMDGFKVMPMKLAAPLGDIFITVTGDVNVLDRIHFGLMKDGAILCNSGHFDVEINIPALKKMSRSTVTVRNQVEKYTLRGTGKRLYVLSGGRLVNLSAAEGHPASVMDMSFANQVLSAVYIATHGRDMAKRVVSVPEEIDSLVAQMKLNTSGIAIDSLSAEQNTYLSSWKSGT